MVNEFIFIAIADFKSPAKNNAEFISYIRARVKGQVCLKSASRVYLPLIRPFGAPSPFGAKGLLLRLPGELQVSNSFPLPYYSAMLTL